MYRKILVAIDGSDPSINALNEAVELSSELGSELTILSVVEELRFPFSAHYGLWAKESHEALMRNVLENLNEELLKIKEKIPNLKIDTRIEEGRPAKKIIELADKENFDLIIIGRQGYGMIEGFILGSVSSEVVNTSTKPVLVIK